MFAMKRAHDLHGMRGAIEEIRVAERNMLRAGRHLAAYIFENDVTLHDAKCASIHRDHGTVTAQVLASTARLRVADNAGRSIRQREMRIIFERRQVVAIWNPDL